jgi:hypothetical protein
MFRRPLSLLVVLLLLASTAIAAEKKPLTVDDMWAVQRVGAPALSPDNSRHWYGEVLGWLARWLK